jgi:hypothetical protein
MTKETSDIQAALTSVMGGLLSRAADERSKSEPYKMLFGTFKDGGIAAAVYEAERQMTKIAMDLMQLLESVAGVEVDNDVFAVLMGLPVARYMAEKDIAAHEGRVCCVDKTHVLMRTFLYERLGLNIEQIPYQRKEPAAAEGDAL